MVQYQSLLESFLRVVRAHFWIEAGLALIAALFAIALRRQKRLFKPSGFIMLSVGLLLDMLMPHTQPLELWMRYWRAAALTLVLFGVIQLAVETVLVTTRLFASFFRRFPVAARSELAIRCLLNRVSKSTDIQRLGPSLDRSPRECGRISLQAFISLAPQYVRRLGFQEHGKSWLPFLDTYRTMCLVPPPEFRRVLEEGRVNAGLNVDPLR